MSELGQRGLRRALRIVLRSVITAILLTATPGFTQGADSSLLSAREGVWRAWFAGEVSALLRYLPSDTIAIDPGEEHWKNRDEIVAAATQFKNSGARLLKLEFPRTEIRRLGRVVILYSTYIIETEHDGQRSRLSGRATEIFIKRGRTWTNPGWHLDSGN